VVDVPCENCGERSVTAHIDAHTGIGCGFCAKCRDELSDEEKTGLFEAAVTAYKSKTFWEHALARAEAAL
jgi:hypothetical protein